MGAELEIGGEAGTCAEANGKDGARRGMDGLRAEQRGAEGVESGGVGGVGDGLGEAGVVGEAQAEGAQIDRAAGGAAWREGEGEAEGGERGGHKSLGRDPGSLLAEVGGEGAKSDAHSGLPAPAAVNVESEARGGARGEGGADPVGAGRIVE